MRNSIVLLAALCVSACATAPFDYPREASVAIDPDTETTLSGLVDAWYSIG